MVSAVQSGVLAGAGRVAGGRWLRITVGVTALGFAASAFGSLGGAAGADLAFTALLFLATSVHVASTGWLYSLSEVRNVASSRPWRMVILPLCLVVVSAAVAALSPVGLMQWLLVPFFAWQLYHYSRQNLGLACLASLTQRVPSLTPTERRFLTSSAIFGISGVVARVGLLNTGLHWTSRLLLGVAALGFGLSVAAGLLAHFARPSSSRSVSSSALFVVALAFSLPVFLFSSPYLAIGGMTLAHGLHYLVLVGFVASSGRSAESRRFSWALLLNVALVGGGLLALASHLHGGGAGERLMFGAYLGVVMSHFVVDSALWRQSNEASRTFMTERLVFLRET